MVSSRRISTTCWSMAGRSSVSVCSTSLPVVAARSGTRAGRPMTAAARSTDWVSSGRACTRAWSSSCRVAGSRAGWPGFWVACMTSCSANSGLPADRASVVSTNSGSAASPASWRTKRAVASWSRRFSSTRSVFSSRASSATQSASGVAGTTASARSVTSRTARSLVRLVARKRTRSSVDRSAQCTSSTTWRTGAAAPSRSTRSSTDWNSPSWDAAARSAVRVVLAGAMPGTSRASSGSRSSWRFSVPVRSRRRRAWVSGANGNGSPAMGTHEPASSVTRSWSMSSRTSRVFPTPVSPVTMSTLGWPAEARRTAVLSTPRASSRPTNAAGGRPTIAS